MTINDHNDHTNKWQHAHICTLRSNPSPNPIRVMPRTGICILSVTLFVFYQGLCISELWYSSTNYPVSYSVSRDIAVQHIQSVRILQYQLFSQYWYSSTTHSVGKDILVQNIQSVGIFQYKTFSKEGYCSTKHSVLAGIFQCKIFSLIRILQCNLFGKDGYYSTMCLARKDIPVQNIQFC